MNDYEFYLFLVHERRDRCKWFLATIAFVLMFVFLAGICMQLFAKDEFKPSNWFVPVEQSQSKTDGGEDKFVEDNGETAVKVRTAFSAATSARSSSTNAVSGSGDFVDVVEDRIILRTVNIIKPGDSLTSHDGLTMVPVWLDTYDYGTTTLLEFGGTGTFDRLTFYNSNPFTETDNYMSNSTVWRIIDDCSYAFSDVGFSASSRLTIDRFNEYAKEWVLDDYSEKLENALSSSHEYTFFFSTSDNCKISYAVNVKQTIITAPEKAGQHFVGWYYDEELTKPFYSSSPITGDITLYAKYEPNVYTVTYVYGIDDNVLPDSTVQAEYNTTVELPTPTYTGYEFLGWYRNNEKVETLIVTSDATLYAKWSIKKCTITFMTEKEIIATVEVDYGTILSVAVTQAGYAETETAFYTLDGDTYDMSSAVITNLEVYVDEDLITPEPTEPKENPSNAWKILAGSVAGIAFIAVICAIILKLKRGR